MSTLNWPNIVKVPDSWLDTFRMIVRQVIEPQLQSTSLGRWIKSGHQRLSNYESRSNLKIITYHCYKQLDPGDQKNYTPVELAQHSNTVLGRQQIMDLRQAENKEPSWMKNSWRGNQIDLDIVSKIINRLKNDDLCIASDGSVRDQMGSYAWCEAKKDSEVPILTFTGPVDGHRHHSLENRIHPYIGVYCPTLPD